MPNWNDERRGNRSRGANGMSRNDARYRNQYDMNSPFNESSGFQHRDSTGYGYAGGGRDLDTGRQYGDLIETGSSFSRGGSYGRSYGSPGMNRDINYGQGGDLSNLRNIPFGSQRLENRPDFTGRGPKGYKRSDERIMEEVCDALERHPWVDASAIEVGVNDGIVVLKGSIDDRRQKRMAEDAIERLRGVKDVRNELMLSQGSGWLQEAKETGDVTPDAASRSASSGPTQKPKRH